MTHPLAPKLTEMTDEELMLRQAGLSKRLSFALAHGNPYLAQQIQALMDDYSREQYRRFVEAEKEMAELLGEDKMKNTSIDIS